MPARLAGRPRLLIADVSGHGVSAAMLTGIVKSAFHASHVDGFEPMAVVQRVSMGLAAFSPDRFVTLVAALISPDERQLRYVNAGHPPIVLWGSGREPLWLASTGPLVSPVLTSVDVGCSGRADGRGRSRAAVHGRRLGNPRRRGRPRGRAVHTRDRPGFRKAARRCSTRFSPTSITSWRASRSPTISPS